MLPLAKGRIVPEVCVGCQAVIEAFRGVEASDLNDVIALWVVEEWTMLFAAHGVEIVQVASRALVGELLVQAVNPVGGSRHISYFVAWHLSWNELADRVSHKDVSFVNMRPDPCPHFLCLRVCMFDKVRAHLDMRSKDDRAIRIQPFRDGYKDWHLRIVNDDHVSTTFRSWC